jgi:endonuclease VIII
VPEGDTIYRAARTLHRALAGQAVTGFTTMLAALAGTRVEGRTIMAVRSAGKHLLVEFSEDLVLRTHMRMHGSWHLYRRGELWQRPHRDMRIVIATHTLEAVGFRIPVAEFVTGARLQRHAALAALGPDLLADDFDEAAALARMKQAGDMAMGDLLLNQRVMAGIGNVYKSEILFACRVNPFVAGGAVDDATLAAVIATARRFLRSNVSESLAPMTTYSGFRRTTRRDDPGERLWVYGRARTPCRRCGTAIRMRRQGVHARSTYWCPSCQPAASVKGTG